MELSARLKTNRERLGLSQEEAARRVYVSRQTMSSWETGKTYPDVQSLMLLSELYGVSIDELVKGDLETMKEVVSKDAVEMERYARGMMILIMSGIVVFIIICSVLHAPFLDTWLPVGFFVGLPILVICTVAGCLCGRRADKIKERHNLVTYKEISAFMEGGGIDDPIPVDESAFSRVHPHLSNVAKALCGAVFGIVLVTILYAVIDLIRFS